MFFFVCFSLVHSFCDTCYKDSVCDPNCNDKRCLYDLGDCHGCSLGCFANMLGDDTCNIACFVDDCWFDDFDCVENCNESCSEVYIGDGVCDQECNTAACQFDGGDCSSLCAPECSPIFIGDGFCDINCLTSECSFDLGDCNQDIFISPGSNGSGSESDPFGTIQEAFDSIAYDGLFTIHLSPGIYYINQTITLEYRIGLVIKGQDSEIRIGNLTYAFYLKDLIYFEVNSVAFDGSEFWVKECDEDICRFVYIWDCDEVCTNWKADQTTKDDLRTLKFWSNCVGQVPLVIFELRNVDLARFYYVNVKNFGYFGSLVNATGSSLEIYDVSVSQSEIFDGVIKIIPEDFSSNIKSFGIDSADVDFVMKTFEDYLIVSNLRFQNINFFNNPLFSKPCFKLSLFSAVKATGLNKIDLSNFSFTHIGSNINDMNSTGLIKLENCQNFNISNITLSDGVLTKLSLIEVMMKPNYFLLGKGTGLIQKIKIENVFSLKPLINLLFVIQSNKVIIRDLELEDSSLYSPLVYAKTNIIISSKFKFSLIGMETGKMMELRTGVYLDDVRIRNLYLNDDLMYFYGLNIVQVSNYQIFQVSKNKLADQSSLILNYESVKTYEKKNSFAFLTFNLTREVNIQNGLVGNLEFNETIIKIDSQLGLHEIDGLILNDVVMFHGILVINGTLGKVSLASFECENAFFINSTIYSEFISDLQVSQSYFPKMNNSVLNVKSHSILIENSKFIQAVSPEPLIHIKPLFFNSSATVSNCKFFKNTGSSPIDVFIDPGISQMTVLFKDCSFSESFGISPISFGIAPKSEFSSITFDNISVSQFVSTNCKLYLDKGIFDTSSEKGKIIFLNSAFEDNSNSQSMSPIIFHNNENSEKISIVNCRIQNNRNDIFLIQNNILVKQNSVFDECFYFNNSARLVSLQNSNSYVSNSQFIQNKGFDDIITAFEKSTLSVKNSVFTLNQGLNKGSLIKVLSAESFICSDSVFTENNYKNTYIFDLSYTAITLSNIQTTKNAVYNLIVSSTSTLKISNMTSEFDNSTIFFNSKTSTISIENSFFNKLDLLFDLKDNIIELNSVTISNINEQVWHAQRNTMALNNLIIKDSLGSMVTKSSIINFEFFEVNNSASPIFQGSTVRLLNSVFLNTAGVECDDSQLTIKSSVFEFCSFALVLRRSTLQVEDSSISFSQTSAIQSYNSVLSINSTLFTNNKGNTGGALFLNESSLNLYSSTLLKNSALQGGAIFYSNSNLTENENLYHNNSAEHGIDKATPFAYFIADQSNTYTISSGYELQELNFYLRDELNQTIYTDSTSLIEFSAKSTYSSIKGQRKFFPNKGSISLDGTIIDSVPGQADKFQIFSSDSNSLFEFTLNFKNCTVGEVLLSNSKCKKCENNTYSLSVRDEYCKPCPLGAVCRGENFIFPAAGYWASQAYPEHLYPCMNPLACIEGSYNKTQNCAYSYEGTLCASCVSGYKLKGSYNCTKCPKYWLSWLIVIISGVLILGFIGFMVYSNIKNLNKSKSELALLLKILVNYCQTIVVLASIDLKWPTSILYLFDFSTAIGESSSQVINLTCSGVKSNYSSSIVEALTTGIFPFIVIFIVFLVWGVVSAFKRSLRFIRVHFISTCVVVVLLMHTSVSNTILSLFSCKKINGVYWNTSDYNLKCFESQHMEGLLNIGVPGVIIWCISVPSVMFIGLFRHKKQLEEEDTLVKFKTLFSGYKAEFYYWEFLIITRKFFIRVIAILLISSGITIQGLGIMVILILSLSVHINYKPYEKASINKLEQYCILTLILYVCGGIVFSTDISEKSKKVIGWILFILNLLFLAYWSKFFFRGVFDIIGKTKLYERIKNKFFFRKKCKINVNNDSGVKVECTYKSGADDLADRSLDAFFPKNPSNSFLGHDEYQPKCNVWTLRHEER